MIAFDIGREPINYPLSFTLAVLASFLWIIFSEREETQQQRTEAGDRRIPDPFLAAVAALSVGFVAARLGYIALHINFFRLNPADVFFIWEGGLSGVAGGSGALLGLGIYALYSRGDFWTLADALSAPNQFVLLGSWAGCWFEGCAYRMPTDFDPLILGTDLYGSTINRWPTQAMGVILSVASFALLVWLGEQETPSGLRFALSSTAGALSAAVISLYRSDPVLLLGPARLDTWGYALLALIGLLMMGARLYPIQKA
jgi:prolipoprotein diacylglyceryltransferase